MKRFLRLLSILVPLALLGGTVWGWTNRQNLYDWYRLRGYQPSSQIVSLARSTAMNDLGRRIFYVQHPELNNRSDFNHNCRGFGEETIVLGCYVPNTGIYIFDIQDNRLDGAEQVTAAHEMLHAAYDRLSATEKARVDRLIAEVQRNIVDPRIRSTIANYRRRDPGVVPDELHSIVATEVRSIPAELETYYRRYFTDRLKVVTYSERYEATFTARRAKAATIETETSALRTEIERLESELVAERALLDADRPTINTQQAAVAYNARVDAYNASIIEFNALVERHNNLVAQFKLNALEQESLLKAIDSRPTL